MSLITQLKVNFIHEFISKKKLRLYFLLLIFLPSLKASSQTLSGNWVGTVNQSSIVYNYTLNIQKTLRDSIFGVSITSTKDFYCQTNFKGIAVGDKVVVQETSIIKTNFKLTQNVCLMKINFTRKNQILSGEFSSSSQKIKDCGSGTIKLNQINSDIKKETKPKDSISVNSVTPVQVEKIEAPNTTLPTTTTPKLIPPATREIEKREEKVIDQLQFAEDSVTITIYDNGVIDEDFISLVVNDRIIFDKVKLSASPLVHTLKRKEGERYSIAFHAETLGTIPPNTGLIILTAGKKRKELLFTSDLEKTATIQIKLTKK
jgi:hypothetical protein